MRDDWYESARTVLGGYGRTAPAPPAPESAQQPPVRPMDRSCCCCAAPMFRVVMPVTGDRGHTTDLLLCGHHYRVSHARLTAAGATVFDVDGRLVDSGSRAGFAPGR